jgi:hypothetical protein
MQYSRGSSADYDEWARIVEDDAWKWESTKERFKRVRIWYICSVLDVSDISCRSNIITILPLKNGRNMPTLTPRTMDSMGKY